MDDKKELPETGCCPRFDPEPWNEKEITWKDKLFVKDRVRSLFHIPLNFGKVMIRNMKAINAIDAEAEDVVVLSDENSLWGADVYIAVTKDVPGVQMAKLSGDFITKVYEGPFKDAPGFMTDMQGYVQSKGKEPKKTYFYYTTCPKCAKVYGKNYIVLLAQV